MDHIPIIVDCLCGLRYMRSEVRMLRADAGQFACACGDVLGAWDGDYRMVFEAEDEAVLH